MTITNTYCPGFACQLWLFRPWTSRTRLRNWRKWSSNTRLMGRACLYDKWIGTRVDWCLNVNRLQSAMSSPDIVFFSERRKGSPWCNDSLCPFTSCEEFHTVLMLVTLHSTEHVDFRNSLNPLTVVGGCSAAKGPWSPDWRGRGQRWAMQSARRPNLHRETLRPLSPTFASKPSQRTSLSSRDGFLHSMCTTPKKAWFVVQPRISFTPANLCASSPW